MGPRQGYRRADDAAQQRWLQLNVFAYDNHYYGDIENDGILDRLPPNTAAPNYLNISAPPKPHLAWALVVDDATLQWSLEPRGESLIAALMYALLLAIPIITGALAVVIFMWSFYGIKYNKWGVKPNKESSYFPILGALKSGSGKEHTPLSEKVFSSHHKNAELIGWPEVKDKHRCVLIATLEYEIIDRKLKVKIGGLDVMSRVLRARECTAKRRLASRGGVEIELRWLRANDTEASLAGVPVKYCSTPESEWGCVEAQERRMGVSLSKWAYVRRTCVHRVLRNVQRYAERL